MTSVDKDGSGSVRKGQCDLVVTKGNGVKWGQEEAAMNGQRLPCRSQDFSLKSNLAWITGSNQSYSCTICVCMRGLIRFTFQQC